jgi:FtsP/CotA-like multicopper oxidase with cupredoxin domain
MKRLRRVNRRRALLIAPFVIMMVAILWLDGGATTLQGAVTSTELASLGSSSSTGNAMTDPAALAAMAKGMADMPMMGRMTAAERQAAADRAAKARAAAAARGTVGALYVPTWPNDQPDYFGTYPNWALSPLPTVDPTTHVISGGIRKFVDTLPGLGSANKNDLGQYIPVAAADTTTYSGSDYYEIALVQFIQQLHRDLPPTKIRGYVQLETPVNASTSQHIVLTYPSGSVIRDTAGTQVFGYDKPMYLGTTIVAQKDRPVRVKFINYLPTGSAGDLFIPVDTTTMGAGTGPNGGTELYKENRATLHLHGGMTPWISDGTPHQWTTPAGEGTSYPKGVSVSNVPDMPDPGPGSLTFFYTNQQSARLMFYHDHAYGITRLNVYAGEAAPYVVRDAAEQGLIDAGLLPSGAAEFPLVIQDKSFVPASSAPVQGVSLAEGGENYTSPSVVISGGGGTGATAAATVTAGVITGIALTNGGSGYTSAPTVTINDPTGTGAFATAYVAVLGAQDPTWDTAKYGGFGSLWFPHVYMPNQNPYDISGANAMGRWDYGPWFWPIFNQLNHGPVTNKFFGDPAGIEPPQIPGTPNPSMVPEGFMDTPLVNGTPYPVVNVDPKAYRLRILNAANDRFLNLSLYQAASNASMWNVDGSGNPTTLADANAGEVVMVPAAPGPGTSTYTNAVLDNRVGGVPDDRTAGPPIIQIGTEGGFLPTPVVIPAHPIGYNYNRRDIVVLNVIEHALYLGPAERADVIVDFSAYAGKTLILYNDAPAPVPAFDPRNDYYTGDPDQTSTGGAPSTLPGYGPNTRTIMQIKVAAAVPALAYNLAGLQARFTGPTSVFATSQDPIIVPQAEYNSALGKAYTDVLGATLSRIADTSLTFTPEGAASPRTFSMQPKAIQELFEMDYGRMNATLGVELPFTNSGNQTTIPLGYVDPGTEALIDSMTPLSPVLGDGTQIWKITHNGVDTHAIHFHLFNVQVINRVGWDGAVRKVDPNELGWKETVKMNPLEDIIVAMRPVAPKLAFGVPDSSRAYDVTKPIGATWASWDPITGNPITVVNQRFNFGWEYVWHCHLLGHEENDMMRPMSFSVAQSLPAAPVLSATSSGSAVLFWTDGTPVSAPTTLGNPTNEIGYWIERAPVTAGVPGAYARIGSALANKTSYTDSTAVVGTIYSYRVIAYNAAGESMSNAVTVNVTVAGPTATRYEETNPLLVYAGTWLNLSGASYSGGSMKYVSQSGASVTAYFFGTSLTWLTKTGPSYGKARVSLDGGTAVLVDLYSPSTLYQQQVWSTGPLPNGPHSVKIQWSSLKNPAATFTYLGVDAFDVTGMLRLTGVLGLGGVLP